MSSVNVSTQTYSYRPTYLFVLPWSLEHVGGVNQVVINLARQMEGGSAFYPLVLISDWRAKEPVYEEIFGVKVVRWRIRTYTPGMRFVERLKYCLWEKRFVPLFRNFCLENKVEAVNPHYPCASAISLKRLLNLCNLSIPFIISLHGSDLAGIKSGPVNEIEQWRKLFSESDGVVVCSSDLAKRFVDVFDDQLPLYVIHNGLDASAFLGSDVKPLTNETSPRFILSVAKFEEKKGLDVLIQAFSSITDQFPDLHLILIGATAKALEHLKEMCVCAGVDKQVHFYTDMSHQDVADFYRRATLFALPSRQEPFGIVLLEAGLFGLPVVASCTGGIPEIITDGVNGRLVEPDNSKELATCITELLRYPKVAEEMGLRLRQHVISRFSWTLAYEKYISILHREDEPLYLDANP